MKNKKITVIAVVAVALIVAGWFVRQNALADDVPSYRLVSVERGDIAQTVSATGVLGAVKTVSVGTQVSGQLSEVLVDFNDRVKKGQLLARIDPTLAQQAVTDAQANLARASAQAAQARSAHARNSALRAEGLVAASEFDVSQSSLAVAQANVRSAQVALDRARQNLSYTSIYAPIDGVVVERNVDVGQTVAASLQAPQLFLIANDLTRMQILASVDESDIAQIRTGQDVKFTVQALPSETFTGEVQQVRLQSTTQENVVSYTVVVDVANPDLKLLPGMTARVEFLVTSAEDVLKVPNAALRFRPTTTIPSPASRVPTPQTGRRASSRQGNGGTLYQLNDKGEVTPLRVRTGITDGTVTEVRGEGLKEGLKVIAGTMTATGADTQSNPFSGNRPQQGGPRPPGGF